MDNKKIKKEKISSNLIFLKVIWALISIMTSCCCITFSLFLLVSQKKINQHFHQSTGKQRPSLWIFKTCLTKYWESTWDSWVLLGFRGLRLPYTAFHFCGTCVQEGPWPPSDSQRTCSPTKIKNQYSRKSNTFDHWGESFKKVLMANQAGICIFLLILIIFLSSAHGSTPRLSGSTALPFGSLCAFKLSSSLFPLSPLCHINSAVPRTPCPLRFSSYFMYSI